MSGHSRKGRRMDPLRKKSKKEDMVSFLTSSGTVKEGLARSLYDQGLDRWSKLIDGDEGYFLSFRGVGPKIASDLLELACEKRKAFETKEEKARRISAVNALLEGVPRLRRGAKKEIIEAGYDSIERLSTADPSDLKRVRGVGPKLSNAIIEGAKAALVAGPVEEQPAVPPQPGPPVIEEATGLTADEAPKEPAAEGPKQEKGFFARFIDGFKRFFSTAKEESPKVDEPPSTPIPEEPPAPIQSVEVKVEPEAAPTPEIPPAEAAPESPLIEPPAEQAPSTGVTVTAEPEKASEEAKASPVPGLKKEEVLTPPSEGTPAVPPSGERKLSFIDKLKATVFGGKKAGTPPEARATEGQPEQMAAEGASPSSEPSAAALSNDLPMKAAPGYNNFEDVPGLDPAVAQKLRDSGYLNMDELKEAIPEDLMMIEGISKETAESICKAVKTHV